MSRKIFEYFYAKIYFMKENKLPIIETLKKYRQNPGYGFHIPGHTRGNAIHFDFLKTLQKMFLRFHFLRYRLYLGFLRHYIFALTYDYFALFHQLFLDGQSSVQVAHDAGLHELPLGT